MSYAAAIALLLAVVAVASALPGAFLILRRVALVSDAIGHVLLLGIVLAYFLTRDLDSPWLLVGAAAAGVLAVALMGLLQRTQLVKEDAAIGLVFPALFAAGVLLASIYLRNTHLDVDSVLVGQPEFATEPRWWIAGVSVKPLWVSTAVLVLNVALLAIFYKELKLTTFDPELAAALGFRPGLVHYALMTVVSITAVAAFDSVGPVLVVGFFIVPAATAYLLTDRLAVMIGLAAAIGAFGAVTGSLIAIRLDTNIAGTVTSVLGILFAMAFVAAPNRGLLAQVVRRHRQKRDFHETVLAIHLYQHEGTEAESDESAIDNLHSHLKWSSVATVRIARRAERNGLVTRAADLLKLTELGRRRVLEVLGEEMPLEVVPQAPVAN